MPSNVFDPNFLRSGQDLQNLILALLKGGLNKSSRDNVGAAIAKFVDRVATPALADATPVNLNDQDVLTVKNLRKLGYAIIPDVFSPADIATIYDYIGDKKVRYGSGGYEEFGGRGEVLVQQLPPGTRFGHYNTAEICSCATIYRAVNSKQLIRIVAAYLGAPPTISSVSMWWSFPADQPIGGMQMYHHDRGDFRSCNLFVYLTDVYEGSGPHAFVEQTHEIDVLAPLAAQRFGGDPKAYQKFWIWMEQHRKEDAEVSHYFPAESLKCFTGPKGMSFLEDTRGLHKGTAPTANSRLAFEIVYSTLPKYNEKFAPMPRSALDLPDIETDVSKIDPLVRYAARLMYT